MEEWRFFLCRGGSFSRVLFFSQGGWRVEGGGGKDPCLPILLYTD